MRNPFAILARVLIGFPLYAIGFLAGLVSTPLRAGFTAAEAIVDDSAATRVGKPLSSSASLGMEAR